MKGDRKSVTSDRVLLVKGPPNELKVIRRIFRLALKQGSPTIVQRLNREGIRAKDGGLWTRELIDGMLRNPIYAGYYVWGRTAFPLRTYRVPVPRQNWIVKRLSGPPIVREELFQRVQAAISHRRDRPSDKELLDELRRVLATRGKLSTKVIKANAKHYSAASHRFGGLMRVYKKLG